MEKSFLEVLDREIADIQAQIDNAEMFGGNTDDLNAMLAELIQERATEISRETITLEDGITIRTNQTGAWGRLHFVSYALGPQDADEEEKCWICTLCHKEITRGEAHYRRSYYTDKSDNRTGRQARLCEACAPKHGAEFPPSTTFPVYKPARQKTDAKNKARRMTAVA